MPHAPSQRFRFRPVTFGALAFVVGTLVVGPSAAQDAAKDAAKESAQDAAKTDAAAAPAATDSPTSATEAEAKPEPTKPKADAPAQRLLVTELTDQGAGADLTATINAAIAAQAKQSYKGEVTSTTEVRAKLELSAKKVLSGCVDDNCYFNAAKVVGAEKVLGGSVSKVGDDLLINIIVINGRDGSRVTQVQKKTPALQELATYTASQSAAIAIGGAPTSASVPVVIRVQGNPADTVVMVDGEDRGAPPLSITLAPGSHDVEIRSASAAPYRTTFNIEPGSPILVEAKLGSDRIELWPVAAGLAAASAVALVAGVTFGAFANLNYDGTVAGFPLGDPDESYVLKSPATSVELAEKEQTIGQLSVASNVLTLGAVPLLAAGAVGVLVADFVLGSSAAE